jgi:type II secretory ATPase GspE/PulE/Tfp pilus assembly ATPase PilB-like protein
VQESPIVRFTNAILLVAHRKGADKISFRDQGNGGVVVFTIKGALIPEFTDVPLDLKAQVIRRIIVMANLPVHGRDEEAYGYIELVLRETEVAWFAVRVSGHGPTLDAVLRRVDEPMELPHRTSAFR